MPLAIEETSTVTAKGQTTVPKVVRDALGIRSGDRIAYRMDSEGTVLLSRCGEAAEESAVDAFLAFLSRDIKERPHAVTELSVETAERRRALTEGVETDLDGDFCGATPL